MTASRPEPLTCETALERLDAAWLDPLADELADAELLAAREHLQGCSACGETWETRRVADRRIAAVMQAVSVPAGLREQLLAQSVTESPSIKTAAASSVNRGHRLHRRVWWLSVAALLLVSVASGSWAWRLTHPQQVSMQTLCDFTPLTPAELEAVVDPSKLPPLPVTWGRTKGLRFVEPPRWMTLPDAREPLGWIIFEFRSGKSAAIRGVLVMARQSGVSDPPAPLFVRPSWSGYTQRGGQPVSVAGWSEQGVVYLCFVPGEPPSLERVLRATTPTSA